MESHIYRMYGVVRDGPLTVQWILSEGECSVPVEYGFADSLQWSPISYILFVTTKRTLTNNNLTNVRTFWTIHLNILLRICCIVRTMT
jgi:hypothetical protein